MARARARTARRRADARVRVRPPRRDERLSTGARHPHDPRRPRRGLLATRARLAAQEPRGPRRRPPALRRLRPLLGRAGAHRGLRERLRRAAGRLGVAAVRHRGAPAARARRRGPLRAARRRRRRRGAGDRRPPRRPPRAAGQGLRGRPRRLGRPLPEGALSRGAGRRRARGRLAPGRARLHGRRAGDRVQVRARAAAQTPGSAADPPGSRVPLDDYIEDAGPGGPAPF